MRGVDWWAPHFSKQSLLDIFTQSYFSAQSLHSHKKLLCVTVPRIAIVCRTDYFTQGTATYALQKVEMREPDAAR